MQNTLIVTQIILGVLLSACILLQSRSAGLGGAWGGTAMAYHSKRGVEQLLFRATVVLATLFLLTSLASLII